MKTLIVIAFIALLSGCSKEEKLIITMGDSTASKVDSIDIDFNNANIIGYNDGDTSIIYPTTKVTKVK